MEIRKSIDIEDEIRMILADYLTCYCRPLPEDFAVPSILVQKTGGTDTADWSGRKVLDTFDVVLDSRASSEAESLDLLHTAVAILQAAAATQAAKISRVEINTLGSWGMDPVRPDLAMHSATVRVTARPETTEIN